MSSLTGVRTWGGPVAHAEKKAIADTRKERKQRVKSDRSAYLMIFPACFLFAVFVLIPIVEVVYYSFTDYNMHDQAQWIGLKNYLRMLQDTVFQTSIKNTLFYAAGSLFPQLLIAVVIANLLFRESKLVAVFRTVFYLPYVLSMVCVSMVWLWMYDPNSGTFNMVLSVLGFQKQTWLSDPKIAMLCLIVMSIWKSCGYSMVIFLSGLTAIPASLYEAAKLDGANPLQKFWYITWPSLRPTTFFLLITGLVGCFSVFEQVNVMTSGGPLNTTTTIVHQIYQRGFQSNQMGYACAMSVVLFAITSVITLVIIRFGDHGGEAELE